MVSDVIDKIMEFVKDSEEMRKERKKFVVFKEVEFLEEEIFK